MFMPNPQNTYIQAPEFTIIFKKRTINTGGMKHSTHFPSGLQSDPTTQCCMLQLCSIVAPEGTRMPQADDIRAGGLETDRGGRGAPHQESKPKRTSKEAHIYMYMNTFTYICTDVEVALLHSFQLQCELRKA